MEVTYVHVGVWMGRLRWSWRGGRRLRLQLVDVLPLPLIQDNKEGFYAPGECLNRTQGRSDTFVIDRYWA